LQQIEEELEKNLVAARQELQQAERNLRDAKSELRNLSIDLDKNQLGRQTIEQEIIDSIVTAPISGQILNIAVEPGEVVDRSKDLLIIGDPSTELVKLQLSTLNAAKVKPNQLARISLPGHDEEIFTGYVETVSLVAKSEGSESSSRSGDYGGGSVDATVRLDSPSSSLIPGSRVSVDIILEQRENVIAVENAAVQQLESEPFILVRDAEGKAQKKSVTLGLEDLTNGLVEVTAGLKSGDEVILPPVDTELKEGMLVKAFEPESNNQPE
jgi:HlyD family secretion protein